MTAPMSFLAGYKNLPTTKTGVHQIGGPAPPSSKGKSVEPFSFPRNQLAAARSETGVLGENFAGRALAGAGAVAAAAASRGEMGKERERERERALAPLADALEKALDLLRLGRDGSRIFLVRACVFLSSFLLDSRCLAALASKGELVAC